MGWGWGLEPGLRWAEAQVRGAWRPAELEQGLRERVRASLLQWGWRLEWVEAQRAGARVAVRF